MSYTLIIPIYNEERTLSTLLKKLDNIDNNIEIIIIDDGSNDGTAHILEKHNNLIVIHNKSNIGKGASIKKALEIAKNQNIILMDGDLEVNTSDIPKLINKFEQDHANAIVGIRWQQNNKLEFEINRLGNYLINKCFNLLYKTNLSDVLCCFKIINTSLFKSFDIKSKGFSIEIETMANLALNGIDIKEVEIQYNRRTQREGKKLKITDGWDIIWTMIVLRF